MIRFNYQGQSAVLIWYRQKLMTASLEHHYGQEVLCRGFYIEDDDLPGAVDQQALAAAGRQIPMPELLAFLNRNTELLLQMTCQQIAVVLADSGKVSEDNIIPTSWINLAGPLIADPILFEQLWQNCLSTIGSQDKQCLVLEICEHDADDEQVFKRVSFLKQHGFIIAMDDFGSGASNLLRLHQAPFDIIKLDLKLLHQVPENLLAASFYREVINLCASRGCLIVAEGIENLLQSDFVRWAGVDLIQGFLYSRPEPLPVTDLSASARFSTGDKPALSRYLSESTYFSSVAGDLS